MGRIRLWPRIAILILGIAVFGCASVEIRQARAFVASLRVGMPIGEVKELAREADLPLERAPVRLTTLLYFCPRGACTPRGLPERLHYVTDNGGETPVRLEVIDPAERGGWGPGLPKRSPYRTHEPVLRVTWFSLGVAPVNIAVFFDPDTETVVGWIAEFD